MTYALYVQNTCGCKFLYSGSMTRQEVHACIEDVMQHGCPTYTSGSWTEWLLPKDIHSIWIQSIP